MFRSTAAVFMRIVVGIVLAGDDTKFSDVRTSNPSRFGLADELCVPVSVCTCVHVSVCACFIWLPFWLLLLIFFSFSHTYSSTANRSAFE